MQPLSLNKEFTFIYLYIIHLVGHYVHSFIFISSSKSVLNLQSKGETRTFLEIGRKIVYFAKEFFFYIFVLFQFHFLRKLFWKDTDAMN